MKKKTTKKKPPAKLSGKATRKKTAGPARASMAPTESPSRLIDARIRELREAGDGAEWRADTLARIRALIQQALPDVVEEWKWGVPVWSHPACGIICTGEVYKKAVKLTFARGASLPDPTRLFNSSLEGNVRRAIDLHEGAAINEKAFASLVRAAARTR